MPASSTQVSSLVWDVPTRGTVFATLFNYRGVLAALGKPLEQAPSAPVLYVKPANTWIPYGAPIALPAEVAAIEVGATLGVVIGSTASRVPIDRALAHVAGYTVVNDIGEPCIGVEVPTPRQRCDRFCRHWPMGDRTARGTANRRAWHAHIHQWCAGR